MRRKVAAWSSAGPSKAPSVSSARRPPPSENVASRVADQHPAEVEQGRRHAEGASARLGVKRETLYAYASRGPLRRVAGPDGRRRRYLTEDVERLKARHDARAGHGEVAAGALRLGGPVLQTGISRIDPLLGSV